LLEANETRYRLQNSIGLKSLGENQGRASEFTELVLGYAERI